MRHSPVPFPAPLDETHVNELPSSLPMPVLLGVGLVLGLSALMMLLLIFNYGQLWFQAYWSKAPVRFLELLGMSLRKVNARTIVQGRIMAVQAGLGSDITARRLEAHYLAGGDVPRVIRALIVAHRADLDLKIRARVTVRTNLQQLIGGATEETIIARVGEGIITSIGSSDSHFQVMEHPDTISKAVLQRGLDAQTAFQIVSIDIADIEVGENIGARLQADQAEIAERIAKIRAGLPVIGELL